MKKKRDGRDRLTKAQLKAEKLIPLGFVCKMFQPPASIYDVRNWYLRGVVSIDGKVFLETTKPRCRVMTTVEAVKRFAAKVDYVLST